MKLKGTQKNCIGVSDSKILTDATVPYIVKPWGYEEMRNPDEKVNTEAFRDIYVNGQGTADCGLWTADWV